jgi:hypothetical protein
MGYAMLSVKVTFYKVMESNLNVALKNAASTRFGYFNDAGPARAPDLVT